MNLGDETIVSTVARRKRRRSGFRFSSKKVLERSRVKRVASKVGGSQIESVTRALSYPCEVGDIIHHHCAPGSNLPTCLDRVVEADGDRVDLSSGSAVTLGCSNQKVCVLKSQLTVLDFDCVIIDGIFVSLLRIESTCSSVSYLSNPLHCSLLHSGCEDYIS